MNAQARRLPRTVLLACAIAAWWFGFRTIAPWVQTVTGSGDIANHDTATIVGHWLTWQLPGVVVCTIVWLIGERLGLMPSFIGSFRSGGSWRIVVRTGLISSAVLLLLTVGIGAAVGGKFGFHPYFTKMAGDLVSNMYEEITHRGFLFCAFYGVAAGATFPLSSKEPLDRRGLVLGTIGSSALFAAGHGQYPVPLRIVLGVIALVFVWPWVRARSLWAPWIPHTLGDVIGDSILKL